ncbi:MAG: LTA synthase family protein [Lachnospiraceae bacterium]|nr:LTA synthase family protein [Lachnospiraceae bacterium]
MNKDFLNFSFIWRFLADLLVCTGLVIFLIWNRELFYGESQATDQYAMQIEPYRPVFFICMIVLVLIIYLVGVVKAYKAGLRESEDSAHPKGAADEKAAAKKTAGFPVSILLIGAGVLIIANACASFGIIELINNPWIMLMKPKYIYLGIGITLTMYLVLVLLTNSLTCGMILGNILFLVWGATNFFVLKFRATALQFVDFMSIRTALSVAGGYDLYLFWQFIVGITVTVCFILLYLFIGNYHIFRKVRGKAGIRGGAFVLAMLFYLVIFKTDYLEGTGIWLRDWHPQYTYKLFGMEAGFFAFAKASFPEKPDTYTDELVNEVQEATIEAHAKDVYEGEMPENIIVVMNESFSDMSVYPKLVTDGDPMPTVNAMKENTQKGHLMVSVLGGLTANTEYEFLTGNSCVLSPSTVVYNSNIKNDQFSLATTLKAQGYRAVAMHPYKANGWNRHFVYPRMGFDEFLSMDEFSDPKYVRMFISDLADYQEIIRQVEQKEEGEKLFLFNVTMQNHGGYNYNYFNSSIHVRGYEGGFKHEFEQYETLISISDEALAYLIEYFEMCDEKTLIVFFGDHQPAMDDDFLEYAYGKELEDLTFDEQQLQYLSKFLIWANYDIPEKDDLMLSPNFLSSYVLTLTGLVPAQYNNYLNDAREVIPAMNAYGYLGKDGKIHKHGGEDSDPEVDAKVEEYKCLIYDELVQGRSRNADFYGIPMDSEK